MTVSTTNTTSGPYLGNNVTISFSYTFRLESDTQVQVYETDIAGVTTLLTLAVDYTVAGLGVDAGGLITRVAGALPTGYTWYIKANYAETQDTVFASQGGFFPTVHESAIDKLTFLIQQLLDKVSRAVRIPDSSTDITGNTTPEVRANKVIGFDSNNNVVLYDPTLTSGMIPMSEKAALSGVASLDSNGKVVQESSFDVDTVTAMRLLTPVSNGNYYLKFHTTVGGGGHFRGVTGAAPGTYVDNNGTIIVPAGGDGSAAWIRDVGDTLNVSMFGAVNDGTDKTVEMQAALNYWRDHNVTMVVSDTILCNAGLTINFTATATGHRILRFEGGGKIDATAQVAGTALLIKTTGTLIKTTGTLVRDFKIENLYIKGGYDGLTINGGLPANSEWIYEFTLDKPTLYGQMHDGLSITGNCFEFSVMNPTAVGSAASNYPIHIYDTAPAVVSSWHLYNATTRSGLTGCVVASGDGVIHGGTFISAQRAGLSINGNNVTLIKPHVENNWLSAATLATGGPGLYFIGAGEIIGLRATTNTDAAGGRQQYGMQLFASGAGINVVGGSGGGSTVKFVDVTGTTSPASVTLIGNDSYQALFGTRVDVIAKGKHAALAIGKRYVFTAYAATITPNLDIGSFFKVPLLTGNITVNAPTNSYGVFLGQEIVFYMKQDAVGGHTVAWNSVFKVSTALNGTILKTTVWEFIWDGTNWREKGATT